MTSRSDPAAIPQTPHQPWAFDLCSSLTPGTPGDRFDGVVVPVARGSSSLTLQLSSSNDRRDFVKGQVAIIGVGIQGPSPLSPELSYREMIHAAAVCAYRDAGIEPGVIDSFVTVAEDFFEGVSIFDEYTPDQLGGVLKPVHTISGDGLQGLAAAALQIATGAFDVIALESHSKASNIIGMDELEAYALDPIWNRPLGFAPEALGGMEMARYLHDTGTTPEQCAAVVVNNRRAALRNSRSSYGADWSVEMVEESGTEFPPLRRAEVAPAADGCTVLVLASRNFALSADRRPVWIDGLGWSTDSPGLEGRDWGAARYAEQGAARAYRDGRDRGAGGSHRLRRGR